MKKFTISTAKPYDVIVGRDIIADAGRFIAERFEKCKVCVVTDSMVNTLFVDQVMESLKSNGFN